MVRKARTTASIDYSPSLTVADPRADHVQGSEITEAVQEAITQLPHEQRLAVTLHDFNNLGYDEIARVMRCSVGTVRSRLNRGRTNLKNYLRDKGFLGE